MVPSPSSIALASPTEQRTGVELVALLKHVEPDGVLELARLVGERSQQPATELEPGTASPGSTKPSNRHPWAWLLQRAAEAR